jgi:mono/diheme cytochrome c family protein
VPIQVDQPDVFVIQNNNAASLIPQGDTIARVGNGGYQAAAVPFFDPTSYFAQEQELIRAAEQTQLLRIQGTQALLQKALEIQAPALEVAARGQAASAILSAAGLSQGSQAGSVQGVVITRDAAGQVQVLQLEPAQVQNYLHQASQAAAPKPQPAAQPVVADGLVKTFCYACHGTNVAAPSGGLYLGTTPEILQVMRQEKASIIQRVENGTMPPAGSPQPTPQERQGLIQEIQSMLGES